MLRAVGHPVAVNPDTALMRVAREEGWQVMTFDRLRRRVRLAAGVAALGAVGAGAGYRGGRLLSPPAPAGGGSLGGVFPPYRRALPTNASGVASAPSPTGPS